LLFATNIFIFPGQNTTICDNIYYKRRGKIVETPQINLFDRVEITHASQKENFPLRTRVHSHIDTFGWARKAYNNTMRVRK
jgi:hypothetical protein